MELNFILNYVNKVMNTSKSIEKSYWIYKLFTEMSKNYSLDSNEFKYTLLFLQGIVYPLNETDKKLNLSEKTVIKAILEKSGLTEKEYLKILKEKQDTGLAIETILSENKSIGLDDFGFDTINYDNNITSLYEDIYQINEFEGKNSVQYKIDYLKELFNKYSPEESKYITRLILGQLRIGSGFGTVRDACVWFLFPKIVGNDKKFNWVCDGEEIIPYYSYNVKNNEELNISEIDLNIYPIIENNQLSDNGFYTCSDIKSIKEYPKLYTELFNEKFNYTNDIFKLFQKIQTSINKGENMFEDFLKIEMETFTPIKSMLFKASSDETDALDTCGINYNGNERSAVLEYKYDGFRVQSHKKDMRVELYTRNLENVTNQFPDVVRYIQSLPVNEIILDGEIVAYGEDGKVRPFQEISQRIRRKYDIEETATKFPVKYVIFDILKLENQSTDKFTFIDRRNIIEQNIGYNNYEGLTLSQFKIVSSEEEIRDFFKIAVFEEQNEGVMVKRLDSEYHSGKHVGYGCKLKECLDPLDVVITGAEWGNGKRSDWLTSFNISIQDSNGNLKEVGKVSTGFKEKEGNDGVTFEFMTKILKPLIKSKNGKIVEVEPEIILEVAFEEIQESETYSSGYAIRFPRFKKLRTKPLNEISRIIDVEDTYKTQRGR